VFGWERTRARSFASSFTVGWPCAAAGRRQLTHRQITIVCSAVSYEHWISDVVKVVETFGATIMVIGGLASFGRFTYRAMHVETRAGCYDDLRRNLGRIILLGLEVLIVADIVRTIIVDPTLDSVAVLGVIVVIRIVLSFSLEVEINGSWPWNRPRRDRDGRPL